MSPSFLADFIGELYFLGLFLQHYSLAFLYFSEDFFISCKSSCSQLYFVDNMFKIKQLYSVWAGVLIVMNVLIWMVAFLSMSLVITNRLKIKIFHYL